MSHYRKSAKETLNELGVCENEGLSDKQIAESIARHGKNEFTREKAQTVFQRIISACKEPMLILLLFAGVIAVAVNAIRALTGGEADIIECIGIFIAISLSVAITVIMEGRSAKAFETLNRMKEDVQVKVMRGGKLRMIPQSELVVGDIVHIETGDKISADGRLIRDSTLMVDESSLTGESEPVKKDASVVIVSEKTAVADRVNMIYSGTFVTAGSGIMVVTAVGDNTEFGKIARELTQQDLTSTPLQEKLAKLGKVIAFIGIGISVLVFVIQLVFFAVRGELTFFAISEAFITSIVIIVATVPEGLPTIVAVSLAINVIKMSRRNALVKKMVASETVGCVNVICSDKTGTLTENRMTVIDVFAGDKAIPPEDIENEDLAANFAINGTADIEVYDSHVEFIGNPTECALLVALNKAGKDYRTIRKSTEVIHTYPFSSETKNMTTIVRSGENTVVYTKGSPEKIISFCDISRDMQENYERAIEGYQKRAMRVIAFAHRVIADMPDFENERNEIECQMEFDGFVAIRDPLRADVFDAIEKARSAGIEVKMLTGDNIITATAIAKELGILSEDSIAVEAHEIEAMSDDELRREISKIRVIARSTPGVKMRVVKMLKSIGNVVAVTGDGINDAPALKNADVGIAMGITGTEVSKEASDIILTDDSFSTIIRATEWGRGIYENFMRFIQFQLTVNVSSVIVIMSSIIAGFASPFSALQLLWINLIMDGPPGLTLGLEPMREDLMKRKPTPRNKAIVTRDMAMRIVVNGIFIACVMLAQNFTNFLGGANEAERSTIMFALFVVFQLFNSFNSRELGKDSIFKNLFKNKLMLVCILATFILQIIIVQFGSAVFDTAPLSAIMWAKIILCGCSVVVLGEIIRLIKRCIKKSVG